MHPNVAATRTIDLLKEMVERQAVIEAKLDELLAKTTPAEPEPTTTRPSTSRRNS